MPLSFPARRRYLDLRDSVAVNLIRDRLSPKRPRQELSGILGGFVRICCRANNITAGVKMQAGCELPSACASPHLSRTVHARDDNEEPGRISLGGVGGGDMTLHSAQSAKDNFSYVATEILSNGKKSPRRVAGRRGRQTSGSTRSVFPRGFS